MLNFLSTCHVFCTRIASETQKDWRMRWEATYDEIVEKFPNAYETRSKSGFYVVNEGKNVAYFSTHGIDHE
jgi:hypothetical protein